MQDPQKAYNFCANHFLYVLQKNSRNKLCVSPHETYFLFRMFFSQVNYFFFSSGVPLSFPPLSEFKPVVSSTELIQDVVLTCARALPRQSALPLHYPG